MPHPLNWTSTFNAYEQKERRRGAPASRSPVDLSFLMQRITTTKNQGPSPSVEWKKDDDPPWSVLDGGRWLINKPPNRTLVFMRYNVDLILVFVRKNGNFIN